MIDVKDLTLTYPSGKGVFDLDFTIEAGNVTGYLGPNGAGKTTTIRALLGFMSPNKGICRIHNLDCGKNATEIQKSLGYVPGEITFLEGMKGHEFLKFMNQMRGLKPTPYQAQLLERFEVETGGSIKKLSKGNKQKLAIVAAFMHDPEVLILDEPTSGLDPLMQKRFIELIKEEKEKGKTILLSSHMFEEVAKTCDDVIIIREGHIVHQSDVDTLNASSRINYIVTPVNIEAAFDQLKQLQFEVVRLNGALDVRIKKDQVNTLIKSLASLDINGLETKAQTLEDLFMQYYGKEVQQ